MRDLFIYMIYWVLLSDLEILEHFSRFFWVPQSYSYRDAPAALAFSRESEHQQLKASTSPGSIKHG